MKTIRLIQGRFKRPKYGLEPLKFRDNEGVFVLWMNRIAWPMFSIREEWSDARIGKVVRWLNSQRCFDHRYETIKFTINKNK